MDKDDKSMYIIDYVTCLSTKHNKPAQEILNCKKDGQTLI